MDRRPARRADLAILVLLAAAVWAVFGQTRHYPLVDFDDLIYVTDNPHVAAGLSLDGVAWAFTHAYEGYWAPLTWISYMADVEWSGTGGGGLHVTNLAIHAASACLLFVLLRRTTAARWPSALVAALFAIHPLHVESVAWVGERKDVLAGFFWMLTCAAHARYARRPGAAAYAAVVAAFACALMSKPMAVTLPAVLLLLDIWPLGRWRPWGLGAPPAPRVAASIIAPSGRARVLAEKAPLVAMSAAVSVVTLVAQSRAGGVASLDAIGPLTRAGNALVSYAFYLAKTAWPSDLAALYPHPLSVSAWRVAGSAIALAALSLVVARGARRRPYLLVGWLWYLVSLAPVLGLIQAGVQARADRYTYVPMVGIGVIAAWGIADLVGSPASRRAAAASAAVALAAYGAVAWRQVQFWRSSEVLARRAIAVTTDNYLAQVVLGRALRSDGRLDEAVAAFETAVRIRPDFADARDALGEALVASLRPADALPHLAEAARLAPAASGPLVNLGSALSALGRHDEALAAYREAARVSPASAEARSGIGGALMALGRLDEALTVLNEAVRLDPGYAPAHHNIGALLSRMGRAGEAVSHFSEVVRLTPDSVQARLDLGTLLASLGRIDEAIAELSAASRLQPSDVMVRNNLGGALLAAGRVDEAIEQFSEAVRLRPDLAQLRANLDLALARRDRPHRP